MSDLNTFALYADDKYKGTYALRNRREALYLATNEAIRLDGAEIREETSDGERVVGVVTVEDGIVSVIGEAASASFPVAAITTNP